MTTAPAPYKVRQIVPSDYHLEAVQSWQAANRNLKNFARCCYHVENKDALAADCRCSVRTIQFYAAAWSLYQELLLEYGETVSFLWERGEISLWRKAPQLRSTLELSLEKTYEYLETAINNDMTRESFAAHVDNKENKQPQWLRRLSGLVNTIFKIRTDYKSEMPAEFRDRFDEIVLEFEIKLQELTADIEAEPAPAREGRG